MQEQVLCKVNKIYRKRGKVEGCQVIYPRNSRYIIEQDVIKY